MKRALISVYDKDGILAFAKSLEKLGWEIISTGGTYKFLECEGLSLIPVESITSFPEILGGRVKTLHPHIHGGILHRRGLEDDEKSLEELGIQPIDMVVNNLYPFEDLVKKRDSSHEEILENIDIGGPAMVRAAAKNYKDVIIVTDPKDYELIIESLEKNCLSLEDREKLAAKAFRKTAFYDAMIGQYFTGLTNEKFPDLITKPYRFKETLPYGENPHQEAAFYSSPLEEDFEIKKLHGKDLSYNNYNDISSIINIIKEFDQPLCVAMKHTNPCGLALGSSPAQAYQRAYECDPISIYGGVVGFNVQVDEEAARRMHETFLEIVIAPSFTAQALEILGQKEKIRLIECPNLSSFKGRDLAIRQTIGGVLVQDKDLALYKEGELSLVAGKEPDTRAQEDLDLAWKTVKHSTSNAITIAKDGRAIGLGQGQVRRVWALENALKASRFDLEGAVVASDGFFFPDTMETLGQFGIRAAIQPGGSIQDEKVIAKAEELGISLVFTGMRHFRH